VIRTFDVDVICTVTVTVDTSHVSEYGDPLDVRRQEGIYNLQTEAEMVAHLAYNAAANGRDDATRLDGWGDLPAEAVQMRVEYEVAELDVRERVSS
jgi:hypothetical protein